MKRRGCLGALITWAVSAVAVWLTASIMPGVVVSSFREALLVALVLGLLNAIVRPILVLLTLPATVLTLGLFLLVINAAVLLLADRLLDGFAVGGFWTAMLASIVLSVVTSVLNAIVGGGKDKD